MKKLVLIFALLFINLTIFSQTIRRVNNTPGLNDPAVYATAQDAHDAAVAGDIIQLEPSNDDNYGDLKVSKKISIIGIGYDLANTPNTFFDKRTPKLGNVYFENESANSSIMGVEVSSYIYVYDMNISITRCKIYYVYLNQSSTILNGTYPKATKVNISQNLIASTIYCSGEDVGYNCNISNNIFIGGGYISGLKNSVINNNVFNASSFVLNTTKGCVFSNNIIDARNASSTYKVINTDVTGTTVSNNLCTSVAGLPTGAGNVNSATAASVFKVTNPWAVSPFVDSNVELSATSPAKTVGVGSTAIGAFAGGTPYIPSGVPNTPVITTYINTGSGNSTTPLTVTISVRSSN